MTLERPGACPADTAFYLPLADSDFFVPARLSPVEEIVTPGANTDRNPEGARGHRHSDRRHREYIDRRPSPPSQRGRTSRSNGGHTSPDG